MTIKELETTVHWYYNEKPKVRRNNADTLPVKPAALRALLNFVDAVRTARKCKLMGRCDYENVRCPAKAYCKALRDLDEKMGIVDARLKKNKGDKE